ncbi:Gfo/Idh/MocA family oxidoreductase [Paraburkholderia sp. BL10I2N1]|uniref:Gfo/Idh/MocA family oxidoreductase n=1 Tax=Paraburkholderia sp. BL10I2N1 TaxID=1938796 RepID=UPI00105D4C8F|nr:Gfo/Idh/MocA family oxidoreductase [Paraburkholderia sp. BL10I2N1]TDN63167.1 myo-inositol 2-dehydrogenase [Paraburkholderia sp. BL10I2N1]
MRKLRIAVIGAGVIGKMHIRNLVKGVEGAELVAVASPSMARHTEWLSGLGVTNQFVDYKDMLARVDVDAVCICSATNTHLDIVRHVASLKKAMFCEKPLDIHFRRSKEIAAIVKDAGVPFQVGFNRRFDAQFNQLHRVVSQGEIGRPQVVKITSREAELPPRGALKSAGNVFIDIHVHDFDMAQYLMGDTIERVYVEGGAIADPSRADEEGFVDTTVITLKFSNGGVGTIDCSLLAVYGHDQLAEVLGSKGLAKINNTAPTTLEISNEQGVTKDKPHFSCLDRYPVSYANELAVFADSVLNGKPVLVGAEDSLRAERLALAADISYREQRPVYVREVN